MSSEVAISLNNVSKTYRVYGTNYGNEQVVEFRLEEATIIRDEEFRDPEIREP